MYFALEEVKMYDKSPSTFELVKDKPYDHALLKETYEELVVELKRMARKQARHGLLNEGSSARIYHIFNMGCIYNSIRIIATVQAPIVCAFDLATGEEEYTAEEQFL